MKLFTDQMGREVSVAWPPKRIISLVPSQTELLYALGLEEEVVGLTKFCVHPADWRKQKKVVGGTKTLHLDRPRCRLRVPAPLHCKGVVADVQQR